jgi:hypothetical protein
MPVLQSSWYGSTTQGMKGNRTLIRLNAFSTRSNVENKRLSCCSISPMIWCQEAGNQVAVFVSLLHREARIDVSPAGRLACSDLTGCVLVAMEYADDDDLFIADGVDEDVFRHYEFPAAWKKIASRGAELWIVAQPVQRLRYPGAISTSLFDSHCLRV